jgi:hypothetical protein
MAYTKAELSGPVQFGEDKKIFFYDAEDASDSLATVLASGYFNNTDDDIRMAVNDTIQVKTSAGQYMLQVTSSTGGAVGTTLTGGDVPVETGNTSVNLLGYGLSTLTPGTYILDAPTRAGQIKRLLCSSSTGAAIVTSTGGYTIGTTGGGSVTITGTAGVCAGVELIAASTTQYLISGIVETTTQGDVATS